MAKAYLIRRKRHIPHLENMRGIADCTTNSDLHFHYNSPLPFWQRKPFAISRNTCCQLCSLSSGSNEPASPRFITNSCKKLRPFLTGAKVSRSGCVPLWFRSAHQSRASLAKMPPAVLKHRVACFGEGVSLFLHIPLFFKAFRSSAGKKSRFFSLFSRGSYRT